MFISKAYYCYHIHKEKISNSETKNPEIKNSIKHEKKQSHDVFKQTTWNLNKKSIFNIMWATLNLIIFSCFFHIVSDSDWVFIFFVTTFIYCSLYWMLASIIFGKLFGKSW